MLQYKHKVKNNRVTTNETYDIEANHEETHQKKTVQYKGWYDVKQLQQVIGLPRSIIMRGLKQLAKHKIVTRRQIRKKRKGRPKHIYKLDSKHTAFLKIAEYCSYAPLTPAIECTDYFKEYRLDYTDVFSNFVQSIVGSATLKEFHFNKKYRHKFERLFHTDRNQSYSKIGYDIFVTNPNFFRSYVKNPQVFKKTWNRVRFLITKAAWIEEDTAALMILVNLYFDCIVQTTMLNPTSTGGVDEFAYIFDSYRNQLISEN